MDFQQFEKSQSEFAQREAEYDKRRREMQSSDMECAAHLVAAVARGLISPDALPTLRDALARRERAFAAIEAAHATA